MIPEPTPEFRRCPATGRWVILAPERANRPITLAHTQAHQRDRVSHGAICPFCDGHESESPPEVFTVRDVGSAADSRGWQLRAVPNKYPALRERMNATLERIDPFFEARPGFGVHEVIIPCGRHETSPAKLSAAEHGRLLLAYRERIRAHAANPLWEYVQVFQNVGAEAGASLAHLHSQLIALPLVPDAIIAEWNFAAAQPACVYCRIVEKELRERVRVIAETERFVALCPFAPRFSYEFWVMPKFHSSHFETAAESELAELGALMLKLQTALDAVLAEPAYNLFLHTLPLRESANSHYHWHWEVIPRTARAAGFEWGSGCFLNTVPPEKAASELRNAIGAMADGK